MDRFSLKIEGSGPGPNPENVKIIAAMIQARPGVEVELCRFTNGSPMNPQDCSPQLTDVRDLARVFEAKGEEVRQAIAEGAGIVEGASIDGLIEVETEDEGDTIAAANSDPVIGQIGEVLSPTVTNTDPEA